MTHQEKVAKWIRPGQIGCEIGPGDAPIPGFSPRPIYVDKFQEFGRAACNADYFGDACKLPFHSNCLDYVASSHVLEHVANPVAALTEWYRVLRPGGIIYLVVPNRLATWDHTRVLTSVDHLLDDYARGTTNCDATHIDEFVNDIDRSRYHESNTTGESLPDRETLARGMHEAVGRGEEINIHFHTFEPHTLRELIHVLRRSPVRRFNWEMLDEADGFPSVTPSGVLAVIRVLKGWLDRAQAEAFDLTAGADRRKAVVRADAQPFAGAAAGQV